MWAGPMAGKTVKPLVAQLAVHLADSTAVPRAVLSVAGKAALLVVSSEAKWVGWTVGSKEAPRAVMLVGCLAEQLAVRLVVNLVVSMEQR